MGFKNMVPIRMVLKNMVIIRIVIIMSPHYKTNELEHPNDDLHRGKL